MALLQLLLLRTSVIINFISTGYLEDHAVILAGRGTTTVRLLAIA